MRGQVQFWGSSGDGSPGFTYVRNATLEYNSNDKKGNLFIPSQHGESNNRNLLFTVNSFSLKDGLIHIKGKTTSGYNDINFLFSTNNHWDEEIEENRLKEVYKNTPGYYRSQYGDISWIKDVSRELVSKRRRPERIPVTANFTLLEKHKIPKEEYENCQV